MSSSALVGSASVTPTDPSSGVIMLGIMIGAGPGKAVTVELGGKSTTLEAVGGPSPTGLNRGGGASLDGGPPPEKKKK